MTKEHEKRPENPLTLEDVVHIETETALKHNGHVPTLIAQCSSRWVVGRLGELENTHEGRLSQMFAAGFMLAERIQIGALEQVFFISEAWMSRATNEKPPHMPPSQDPDRLEVLIISNLNVSTGEPHLVILEMIRDEKYAVVALDQQYQTEGEGMQVESPLLAAFVEGFFKGELH